MLYSLSYLGGIFSVCVIFWQKWCIKTPARTLSLTLGNFAGFQTEPVSFICRRRGAINFHVLTLILIDYQTRFPKLLREILNFQAVKSGIQFCMNKYPCTDKSPFFFPKKSTLFLDF